MPFVNSFLNYKLSTGARVAGLYSILLSCSMFGMGLWHLQSNYYYNYRNPDYVLERRGLHVRAMGESYITFSVFFVLTSVSLLVGVYKKNHHFSWPWLMSSGIAIIYFILCVIIYGFVRQVLTITEVIFSCFAIFIMTSFYIVVISYVQHMRKVYCSQVAITTNQPESTQPHQYAQNPAFNGDAMHPTFPAYPSTPQPPMNIPTSSNSVHFPPIFYPPPIQSNASIKPPNPQPYREYGPYPSLHYPAPFTLPNDQSAPKNLSILPSTPNNSTITSAAPYDSSIPTLQLQHPYNPENTSSYPDPLVPVIHT